MDVKNIVESVLFASEEPLKISDISERLNIPKEEVRKAINELRKEYNERNSSIEIAKIGQKYVMQLKEEYLEFGYRFSKPEIDKDILKTLALIAYLQPVKVSELRKHVGEKINEHIKFLKNKRLIYSRKQGNSMILGITKYFILYFGIDATNPNSIKEYLINKLNINLGDDKK
ncbi:MAG: SMC-Scp complex subunit ScpB [Thermoplasmata archaeon]|jgi:segregation and condensation protein B